MRKEIITQSDEGRGDNNERHKTDKPIENYCQQRPGFLVRGFLQEIIAFHDVAAGAAGEKLVVKHADKKQAGETRQSEMNLLDLQQNMPAKSSGDFHH